MYSRLHSNFYVSSFILLTSFIIELDSIDFPASFTVVRNLVPPLGIDGFFNQTGCCLSDKYGNPTGYTIVSLDGFKSSSTPQTIQNGISPLSIWSNAFSQIGALKTGRGGSTTSSLQQYILDTYHNNRMSLLMNAFADEAPISDLNTNPNSVGQSIINIVKSTQLDGVSVQFQDFQAVASGNASSWLQTLVTTLRSGLPDKQIVLIIPVTIINQVQLFQQSIVGSLVDLFVLKYFGFSRTDYTNYNSLFNQSTFYPNTAISQLLASKTVSIDLCRTLIAKPATSAIDSFISATDLAAAFVNAQSTLGWFGGYANLDFEADASSNFQAQVLRQVRSNCMTNSYCFCL